MADKIEIFDSKEAEASLKRLSELLGVLDKDLVGLSKKAKDFGINLATIKNPAQLDADIKKQVEAQQKARVAEIKLEQAREKAMDKYERDLEKTRLAELKLADERDKRVAKGLAADAKEEAALAKKQSTYNKLNAALTKLKLAYRDLQVKQELGQKLTMKEEIRLKSLTEKVTRLDGVLKKTDAGMGVHTRSVGNYGKAFDSLGFSVAQMTRESPAFLISMNTGFMALSNNIPIFVDEVNKLIVKNKELQAAQALGNRMNEKGVSVLKKVGEAFFSWQSLISAGIVLLTVFGGRLVEYVSELITGEKAIKKLTKAQEEWQKGTLDLIKKIKDEGIALNNLVGKITSANISEGKRVELIDELISKYPVFLQGLSDENLQNENLKERLKEVNRLYIIRIALQSQQRQIEELFNQVGEKTLNLSKDQLTVQDNLNRMVKNINENRDKYNHGEKISIENKKYEEQIEIVKDALNWDKQVFSQKSAIDKENEKGWKKLFNFRERDLIYVLEAEKINNRTRFGVEDSNKELEKQQGILSDIEKMYGFTVDQINDMFKGVDEITISTKKQNKELKETESITKNSEQAFEKNIKSLKEQMSKLDITSDKYKMLKGILDILEQTYKNLKGEMKGVNDEMDKSQKITKNSEQAFEKNISVLEEMRSKVEVGGTQYKIFTAAIESAKLALRALKGETDDLDFWGWIDNKMDGHGQEIKKAIDVTNSFFDNRLERLDQDREANAEYYDNLISLAEDNEDEQKRLEYAKEARDKELRDKQNKVAKKQTILNRSIAIAEIVYNTSQSVIKAVNASPLTGGLPWSAINAALGAAQIAAIVSQPIPQFKNGKDARNFYEGLAIVNDGGKTEYREDKLGNISAFKGVNTLTHVAKDDIIHKDLDSLISSKGYDSNDIYKATIMASLASDKGISTMRLEKVLDNSLKDLKKDIKDGLSNAFGKVNINNRIIVDNSHSQYRNNTL